MHATSTLLCGVIGFACALLLIPLIRRYAKIFEARRRGFHHTHKAPVSRLGGVALAVSFVLISLLILSVFAPHERSFTILVVIGAALAMFALGLIDDLHPLGARRKLAGQIIVATGAYCGGIEIDGLRNTGLGIEIEFGGISYLVTVFWIVAMTNLINLIDGADGLAGGVAFMVMSLLTYVGTGSTAFVALTAAGMAGALLGFLRYNFPPAKIYMGDGGAYFLGSLIALMSIVSSHKGTVVAALIAPLFALAFPILDMALAVLRRGLKGLPIFRPDQAHIHHRLLQAGFSRTRTVLALYGFSLIFLTIALAVFWSEGRWVPILLGLVCLIVLLAAGRVNFSRDWFSVGRVLGNSRELRKETRYALALSHWLELDAERCISVHELWSSFEFVARKLGFTHVRLVEPSRVYTWPPQVPARTEQQRARRIELNTGEGVTLEFIADEHRMGDELFAVMCELAAEGWSEAAQRWRKANSGARLLEPEPALEPAGSAAPSAGRFDLIAARGADQSLEAGTQTGGTLRPFAIEEAVRGR